MSPAKEDSARILYLPSTLTAPVINRPRRGRLPKSVTALDDFRLQRQVTAYQRDQARQRAEALLFEAETYLYDARQALSATGRLDVGRVSGALFLYVSEAARLLTAAGSRGARR